MRSKFYLIALLSICIAFAGCKDKKQAGMFIPSSAGAPYDVLVVADPSVLHGMAGDAVESLLETEIDGLPQSEPSFKVSKCITEDFTRALRLCRNIIMVRVDNKLYTAPKIKYTNNVYAAPQVIMTIQAPTQESLAGYLEDNGHFIIDFLTRTELNREAKLLKRRYNVYVDQQVNSMFGCHVSVPAELSKHKIGKNFFWAATDLGDRDMNFVIYSYPYTDANTFTAEYFFEKRDSVMRCNIPGPRDGQYMSTARKYVDVYDSSIGDEYVQVARGLWEMKNYDMGGPFVSLSRVDQVNNRVIVAEAFIYAPGSDKRMLMRRMEASLYTLSMPSPEAQKDAHINSIVVLPNDVTQDNRRVRSVNVQFEDVIILSDDDTDLKN